MYAPVYATGKIEQRHTSTMKRQDIKRTPLADSVLASLEPEPSIYRVHDGNGLYFRVKPTGHKSWELRYKKANGKWSWLGIGTYPEITGANARRKVRQIQTEAQENNTPILSKREQKEAEEEHNTKNAFEALALEWLDNRKRSWQKAHEKRVFSGLSHHVFPVFGKRNFLEITPMEWMKLFQGMQEKGVYEQSKKVRRNCAEIYIFAKITGRALYNPLEGLHRFLDSKPSENYSHVTVEQLPDLIGAIRSYSGDELVQLGVRLLLLTFVRPSELREAVWSEFDFKKKLWSIPAARMKKRRDHVVPLSRQAIHALEELQSMSGKYQLLFPGRKDKTIPLSNTAFNMALRRMGYQGQQTGHGFRHIASTILREQGFPRDHVEAQLAHVEGGVSGVYNKAIYLEQRKEMMQWYADKLDSLIAPIRKINAL